MKWSFQSDTFSYYSAQVGKKDFTVANKEQEKYTKTIFLPGTERAVTGTHGGDIIVWEVSKIKTGIGQIGEKKLEKVVTLNTDASAINILLTVDNYLVCGNADGTVRFYDFFFKAEAWFEDQLLSDIKSISFSRRKPTVASENNHLNDMGSSLQGEKTDTNPFACSDFLVADANGMVCELRATMFEAIDAKDKRGETKMMGVRSPISAIAVHPTRSLIAVAQDNGCIGIYDYLQDFQLKIYEDVMSKDKKSNEKGGADEARLGKGAQGKARMRQITCLEFTPMGELLIALHKGEIKIMDVDTGLREKLPEELVVSDSPNTKSIITELVVSADGKYFACSDNNNCISLFKYDDGTQSDDDAEPAWHFHGKIKSHEIAIHSICFGGAEDETGKFVHRLFSIGRDRRLFEYNVANANATSELPVERDLRIETEAIPTACIWYPAKREKSNEELILTANNEYKMKLWNPSAISSPSRLTCLGPTYGGEITKLKLLEQQDRGNKQYLLYQTKTKVVGLIQLPLDGNPWKTMGLIAHPNEVQDICASADGKYVFTCGGTDLAVNMWHVDFSPIEQAVAMGGEGIEPFIRLIEGGREGQTFQDINDFFYYAMIRSKKENTTKTRKLDGQVPVSELYSLMCAMGYYPTKQETDNMNNEVYFNIFAEIGERNNYVDLETFIKMFVNHRPVYGIGKNNIEEAFQAILQDSDVEAGADAISRDELVRLLTMESVKDNVSILQLGEILGKLVSETDIQKALPEAVTAEQFAEDILGFEEVEENEGDEEEADQAASTV